MSDMNESELRAFRTLVGSPANQIVQLAEHLQHKADSFQALAGEIIATLVVNRQRDSIRFPDDAAGKMFDGLLDKWQRQQASLT